jgi:hypothetical protein
VTQKAVTIDLSEIAMDLIEEEDFFYRFNEHNELVYIYPDYLSEIVEEKLIAKCPDGFIPMEGAVKDATAQLEIAIKTEISRKATNVFHSINIEERNEVILKEPHSYWIERE